MQPADQQLTEVLGKIQAGTVTTEDFNHLIEANKKSAAERINRRVRVSDVRPKGMSLTGRVVPKHKGDNDPNQLRGRKNFRGSRKKRLDQAQRDRLAKEAIGFLAQHSGQPISEAFQALGQVLRGTIRATAARALRDPAYRQALAKRCALPNKEGTHTMDEDWLYQLVRG